MDSYSSGDKQNIKTRKPYTITKQRERWTDDEHNSFLEALKLYGRAWQRIEEHIGTKTAVQIRSHAQKFFTKLEKEAVAKGVPIRQTLDIEIPPPRPKRKPNYPYPRKIGLDGKQTSSSLLSSLQSKPESEREENENSKTGEETDAGTGTGTDSKVLIPALEEAVNHDGSYITVVETRNHQKPDQEGDNDIRVGVPRHVPVQVVDGNQNGSSFQGEVVNTASATATTVTNNSYPNFHPLVHVSPNTISSLIVSSLVQNPAAHAAATFAAKLWHGHGQDSRDGDGGHAPSMSAIAAATVAAATAWWAAHGMLPVCYPPCPFPAPANKPMEDKTVADAGKTEEDLSSSEDSPDLELNTQVDGTETTTQAPPVAELHDSNKSNVRKQVDRSSCGSNTTSSSEIETDALEKDKDENNKGSDVNLDSLSRRSRGAIAPNESWKEVSEEGRLAFQALFSREVLPQSFCVGDKELDLNRVSEEEGLLKLGLGGSGAKLNVHYTGFKPYKRCSIESKMVSGSASTATLNDDGKGAKRMRLEAEASST